MTAKNKTPAQIAAEQANAMKATTAGSSVHIPHKEQSKAALLVKTMVADINEMREQNNHPDYIFHQVASNMQRLIEPSNFGEYQSLVENHLGLSYTVEAMRDYDLTTPVDAEKGIMTEHMFAEQMLEESRNQLKDGKEFTPAEMAAFNALEAGVQSYKDAIAAGATPAEAKIKSEEFVKEVAHTMSGGMIESETSWLQAKYVAGATALVAAGLDIVTKGKFTVGAIGGGVVGVGAAYFGADFAVSKIDALKKMDTWIVSGIAAALGTSLGLIGVRVGEFVENRFFNSEVIVDADGVTINPASDSSSVTSSVSAIPAETAELHAYL